MHCLSIVTSLLELPISLSQPCLSFKGFVLNSAARFHCYALPALDLDVWFMIGLVNSKSVTSRYHTRNNKEVLSPLQVAEHNHVGADPHYCALTSNLQVMPLMGFMTAATHCFSVAYTMLWNQPCTLWLMWFMWHLHMRSLHSNT